MDEPKRTALRSEGQAFLVGPTLYLRRVELGDAKTTPLWHPSPYPRPADVAEEQLKKEETSRDFGRPQRFVACRISDDRPVGSAHFERWEWNTATGVLSELYADPVLGKEAGSAIRAEIVRLLAPWTVNEREFMAMWVEMVRGDDAVEEAVADLGMRQAYRLREALWQDGQRRDEIVYEYLSPAWVERLGEPPRAVEGPVEREIRRPASLKSPALNGNPPKNAIMVGEQVYLRPLEAEDMEQIANWSRQETETFFDSGRVLRSPISYHHWNRKLAEDDPASWVRFGIALRENDELIGSNGVAGINWIHKTGETESEIYRPQHRGGGLGTEAKHLLLAYAFDRLGLHMVRSFVWGPNTRSAAALRKQGYRDAGHLNWTGTQNAVYTVDYAFDLLASEWRAARR
jgi:RimJ/RimL family protein N-acetyltransferase